MSLVLEFQNGLRNMGPDGFWEILEEVGWMDLIPKGDRNMLRSRIEEGFQKDPTEAYKVLAFRPFIGDKTADDQDRSWVIRNFADASLGTFNPVKIEFKTSKDRDRSEVSFTHKGKTYKCEVRTYGGYLGDDIVDLVNKAIVNTGTDCRFIRVDSLDNTVNLVFIPERILERAQKKGLIPPKDYSFAYYR